MQYVTDYRPIEIVLENIKCPNIRGTIIANLNITAVNEVGLNIKKFRFQAYDGSGNMARKQQGAANQLKLKTGNENATYFHRAPHS